MNYESFDVVARLLGGAGTRRTALGALLAGAALRAGQEPEAAAKRRRRRRKKKQPNRPKVCYGASVCETPEPGKDFDGCDFSGTEVFVDANAGGSSFRRANFADAIMDDADLQGSKFLNANLANASLRRVDVRGASFRGACLLNTDFTGLTFEGPVLGDAIQCNTRVSATAVLNRDCNNLPPCCQAEAVE